MCWLTTEVACLPEVFACINESFSSAAIEGLFVMAGDSVDLATLQATAANSGADVILGGRARCPKNHLRYHVRLVALFQL